MKDTFEYEPMSDNSGHTIRLLSILPGSGDEPLRCRLFNFSLQDKGHFEAISYAWGSLPATEKIELDGKLFHIRQNLRECLVQLRRPHMLRKVWVDAICVNQDDLEERNSQVKLMDRIFDRATTVIAWLGYGQPDTCLLLQELLSKARTLRTFTGLVVSTQSRTGGKLLGDLGYPDVNSTEYQDEERRRKALSDERAARLDLYQAVMALCRQPLWTRRWIIQEIALGRNVVLHYGPVQIPWSTFTAWCKVISGLESESKEVWAQASAADVPERKEQPLTKSDHWFRSVSDMIQACGVETLSEYKRMGYRAQAPGSTGLTKRRLKTLLADFDGKQCSDSRDVVYALLSLASDENGSNGIAVDYNKSVENLFFELVALWTPVPLVDVDTIREYFGLPLSTLTETVMQCPIAGRFVVPAMLTGVCDGVVHRIEHRASAVTSWPGQVLLLQHRTPFSDIHDKQDVLVGPYYRAEIGVLIASLPAQRGDVFFHLEHSSLRFLFRFQNDAYHFVGTVVPLKMLGRVNLGEMLALHPMQDSGREAMETERYTCTIERNGIERETFDTILGITLDRKLLVQALKCFRQVKWEDYWVNKKP